MTAVSELLRLQRENLAELEAIDFALRWIYNEQINL